MILIKETMRMLTAFPSVSGDALLEGTRLQVLLPGVEHGAFRLFMNEDCCRIVGARADGKAISVVLDHFGPDLAFSCN